MPRKKYPNAQKFYYYRKKYNSAKSGSSGERKYLEKARYYSRKSD